MFGRKNRMNCLEVEIKELRTLVHGLLEFKFRIMGHFELMEWKEMPKTEIITKEEYLKRMSGQQAELNAFKKMQQQQAGFASGGLGDLLRPR